MLDLKMIRQEPDRVRAALGKKGGAKEVERLV